MCYYVKWDAKYGAIDSYRQIRPVFPLDVIPHDAPMLSVSASNALLAGQRIPSYPTVVDFYWWDWKEIGEGKFMPPPVIPDNVVHMPAVNAFYAYSYPYAWSANTGREFVNGISLFFVKDEVLVDEDHFFQFYIIDKAWDGSGGDYSMKMSGTTTIFTEDVWPIGAQAAPPTTIVSDSGRVFYDNYTNAAGYRDGYPDSQAFAGMTMNTPTLPIQVRDDPWNVYSYDSTDHRFKFHWLWYECCTDGMIIGPTPIGEWNMTYEADLTATVGLEQGTRISMWNWLGSAYTYDGSYCPTPGPFCQKTSKDCYAAGVAEWIHYDVPMSQMGTWTQGIQVHARRCEHACKMYENCGECTSQLHCGWTKEGTCEYAGEVDPADLEHDYLNRATECTVCTNKTSPYDCMCEPGCGWAPLEKKCISGTPDYPSDQTVTVVQWYTKGCHAGTGANCKSCSKGPSGGDNNFYSCDAQPEGGCCDGYRLAVEDGLLDSTLMSKMQCVPDTEPTPTWGKCQNQPNTFLNRRTRKCFECDEPEAPRWQCYRAAYNEKKAFADWKLMEEYRVLPATSFTLGHPFESSTFPPPSLSCEEELNGKDVPSGVAFFAYGGKDGLDGSGIGNFSSNTDMESEASVVTFLVQDACSTDSTGDVHQAFKCSTYLLVLIDKPGYVTSGGYVHIDLYTDNAPVNPLAFVNDPNNNVDKASYSSVYKNGTLSLTWSDCCNDGFVLGPMPYDTTWSVNMKVAASHKLTKGLDTFKIGSYDSYRNSVGFVESSIQKITHGWGGLQYEALECTDWCQRYTDCEQCFKDTQCKFSEEHGGCVAYDAYIYDYGCPRPEIAPITKIMHREGQAYARESHYDGFDASFTIRYGVDSRIVMTCPCNHLYWYFATIYDVDDGMRPVYDIKNLGNLYRPGTSPSEAVPFTHVPEGVPMRLDYEFTFVDIPLLPGVKNVAIYSYVCIAQGTLLRDECSPVKIDYYTIDNQPPPPSPPPPASPP